MAYIITNGTQFIGKKCCRVVNDISKAIKFDNINTANNVFKSSISKENKKLGFKVQRFDLVVAAETKVEKSSTDNTDNISDVNDANSTIVNMESKEISSNENTYVHVDIEHLKEVAKELEYMFYSIRSNKPYLCEEQSKVDRMISDIEHYIEFTNFNASDGYKLAKSIQDLRRYRRKIKDEIAIIDTIIKQNNNILTGHTYNTIEGLDNRQYTPRETPILFEDGVNGLLNDIRNMINKVK